MGTGPGAGRVGAVALLTALLAAVASGVGGSGRGAGGQPTSGLAGRAFLDVGAGVAGAAVLLVAGLVAVALWNRRARRRSPEEHVYQAPRVPWGLRLGLVAALAALVFAGFALARGTRSSQPPSAPERPPPELPGDQPKSTSPGSGWDDGPVVAGIALLGVAAVVTPILARKRRRPARPTPAPAADTAPGPAGPHLSVDDLAMATDPGWAVIAAYARMERVLGAVGVARRPSEAPFEYLARIRGAREVAAPPATRLTELFEQAKFSHRGADPAMQAEAVDALRILLDQVAVAD